MTQSQQHIKKTNQILTKVTVLSLAGILRGKLRHFSFLQYQSIVHFTTIARDEHHFQRGAIDTN
jgi:hypothetical protein